MSLIITQEHYACSETPSPEEEFVRRGLASAEEYSNDGWQLWSDKWDDLLIYVNVKKLYVISRRDWETNIERSKV